LDLAFFEVHLAYIDFVSRRLSSSILNRSRARICNGVSLHFDGNFIPVLCVPWTLYGHQSFSTCTARDRLLYYVGLSPNLFPVWPLGGAKGFFSTLNISAVFDIFADFFTASCRASWPLQIPPYLSPNLLPVWGSAPKNKFLFIEKVSSNYEFNFPYLLHDGSWGPPLTSRKISLKSVHRNTLKFGPKHVGVIDALGSDFRRLNFDQLRVPAQKFSYVPNFESSLTTTEWRRERADICPQSGDMGPQIFGVNFGGRSKGQNLVNIFLSFRIDSTVCVH